jgi:tetratricopeptide (TPR) repeat protein
LRKTLAILLTGILLAGIAGSRDAFPAKRSRVTEKEYLNVIRKHAREHDRAEANRRAAEFFKEFPESKKVPDVRLILAEAETSPDESIAQYRVVVTKYRYYTKRDYAQFRICEIEYLLSRWRDLVADAREGLKLGPGAYRDRFRFFLIIGLIHREEYDAAEKECRQLIDSNHDYQNMARLLLILSHIYRSTSGLSREYINTIRETALGYDNADAYPAALFLLGDFYEQKRMYDESYSAYTDLTLRYPGSPEAAEAAKRAQALMKHNPRRVFYLPGKKIVDNTESIAITPEMDVPEKNGSSSYYSISVGPFPSVQNANRIKALIKEFEFIKTVRLKKGYALYVGKSADEESAMKLKVRLAEEYGINGNLVRISGDGRRSYIYGE